MGLLGLGLKLKQGIKAITSVKPTPGKEARIEWLKKAAKFNLEQTFKKTDKELEKLKKTVQKTKHYFKD